MNMDQSFFSKNTSDLYIKCKINTHIEVFTKSTK